MAQGRRRRMRRRPERRTDAAGGSAGIHGLHEVPGVGSARRGRTENRASSVGRRVVRRSSVVLYALRLGLASMLALVVAEPAAQAHHPTSGKSNRSSRWRPPVAQPLVTVSLESARDGALPSVRHRGSTFVAGEHGDRYEIRIGNNSAHRLEVVVSVDGLDAVSGRPGDFTSQRGYVIEPFGSVVIDGFRTSLQRVAAFRFASVGDSFAAKSGAAHNAGVIGVAVFKERAAPIARHHHAPKVAGASKKDGKARRSAPSRPGSATADAERSWSAPSRELGTRFGESRHSAVREVGFTRASARRPDFRTTLHYDSARGLQARGVPLVVDPVWHDTPPADTWPAARGERFSQPPPGWTGRR